MRSHADRQPTAQLKFPRFRLVWTPAAVTDAKWHLRLFGHHYKGTPRRLFVYLGVRNLLLLGTGTTLATYLVGTAALAWLWGQNPYNQISYTDLVLPTHWSELREKRGKGQIAEGAHEIRTGKYATGLMLLTQGLARNPSSVIGRMVLAQVYINIGHLHRAQQLLVEGLVYGPPSKSYREALFRLTGYLEDHERILELADQIEASLAPDESTVRRWLLGQRITALEKLLRYEEIDELRKAHADTPFFALEAAWARAQAARGLPADALEAIARNPGRFGVPVDFCQLKLNLAVAAGDAKAADEAIRAWLKLEPTQPQPRVEEILALVKLGDAAGARDRLNRYFLHYSSEKAAVVLLLKKLSDLPDVRWLQAAHQEAGESGALSLEARILYVQGLLMAGKVSEALTEFNLATTMIESAKANDGGWHEGTKLLLDVIVSDSPSSRSQFLEYFRLHRLSPEAYRFALRSLRSADVTEVAGELAIVAKNRFPAMQDTAFSSTQVAVTAKPGESPAAAFRNETEARMEVRRIDAELTAGNYASAFARLKAVERAGFPGLQAALLTRRIQLQGALREQGELSAALQLYLSRPNVNQEWLRKLALQWAEGQQPDSALTVARETGAKFPQAKWAMELLNRPVTESAGPATPFTVSFGSEAEARAEMRRIDEDLAAGRFTEALDRIKRVERSRVADLQPELLLRRIHAHGALREQTELTAALGYYFSGKTVNLTALRGFATQWDNDAQRDSALSLLRETLAKYPQAQWAMELRKKIEGDLLVAPEKAN